MATLDVRRRPGLSSRLVDGEIVILDRETETIHQLNSTATLVWNRLSEVADLGEIARELSELFEVDEDAALRDVTRVVETLRELRLLVPRGDAPLR